MNETLFAKLKQYDLVRDLAPVSFLASVPFFLVVSGSYPANSLADLIRLARANPGKINYASPGSGAPPHLASEMLNSMAGVQIVNVPYKTVPEAVNDLLAGRVQVQFAVSTVGLPLIRAGRLKALA
ncbi:MAG TPA: tripartite tricarboxylate transporter substrate-binding protein, partial [Anaerolineae bacterium]